MVESDVIERTLQEANSLRQAARQLGIDPSTLLRKAKKYQIVVGAEANL
jgi:transcriptional regulator with PAS, ATPase and Fis domain